MELMNRILVIADYSEQKPIAIMQAVNLAAAYEASLHIVYFCYESFIKRDTGSLILLPIEQIIVNNFRKISVKRFSQVKDYSYISIIIKT